MREWTDQVSTLHIGAPFSITLLPCPTLFLNESHPKRLETAVATNRRHYVCGQQRADKYNGRLQSLSLTCAAT